MRNSSRKCQLWAFLTFKKLQVKISFQHKNPKKKSQISNFWLKDPQTSFSIKDKEAFTWNHEVFIIFGTNMMKTSEIWINVGPSSTLQTHDRKCEVLKAAAPVLIRFSALTAAWTRLSPSNPFSRGFSPWSSRPGYVRPSAHQETTKWNISINFMIFPFSYFLFSWLDQKKVKCLRFTNLINLRLSACFCSWFYCLFIYFSS